MGLLRRNTAVLYGQLLFCFTCCWIAGGIRHVAESESQASLSVGGSCPNQTHAYLWKEGRKCAPGCRHAGAGPEAGEMVIGSSEASVS